MVDTSEQRLTLQEVAKVCGVAPSTVSRILSDYPPGFRVRPETRERVLDTVKRLGFRPNPITRILRGHRTQTIAMLGLRSTYLVTRSISVDAAGFALQDLYQLSGYTCTGAFCVDESQLFEVPLHRVDGLLLLTPSLPEHWQAAERSGIPYVCLSGYGGPQAANVVFDDAQGTRLALEHLFELGHRRVVYVDSFWGNPYHYSREQRSRAYKSLMQAHGLEPRMIAVGMDEHAVMNAVRATLVEGSVTAFLTYSHHAGMQIVQVAHGLGLNVPRQVSVLCFNDLDILAMTSPPLTAVHLPCEEMGRVCAKALLAGIQNNNEGVKRPGSTLTIPERLVVRASTAPPPTA